MLDQNGSPFLAARSNGDHPAGTRDRDGRGRESSTWAEARAYLELYHHEKGIPHRLADRLEVVRREIDRTRTYRQTEDELTLACAVRHRAAPGPRPPGPGRAPGRGQPDAPRAEDARRLRGGVEDRRHRMVLLLLCDHLRRLRGAGELPGYLLPRPVRTDEGPGRGIRHALHGRRIADPPPGRL